MSNHKRGTEEHWHRRLLEPKAALFAVVTTLTISIGGLVEIVPMFTATAGPEHHVVAPYTPLEVAGRDIYVREGCYVCHSQMVRPMHAETLRYGDWSRAAEYQWDRPFQLGSRRIGPDLHRVGGKYPDAWHYEHMKDPRSTSPGSIMPAYSWMLEWQVDPADVQASLKALQRAGTPYSDEDIANAPQTLELQAQGIVDRLASQNVTTDGDKEIVALIAYLQRLGTDRKAVIAAANGGTDAAADAEGAP